MTMGKQNLINVVNLFEFRWTGRIASQEWVNEEVTLLVAVTSLKAE